MPKTFRDRLQAPPLILWMIILLIAALNAWRDLHHPALLIFDGAFVIILAMVLILKNK